MTDAGSVVLRSRAARATRAPLERGDKRKPALLRSIQQNVAFPAPTYVPETEIGREAERKRRESEHMRRLRIQQCMKFKKFQAHKPQWPRLSRLDIYYLPVCPEMKLCPPLASAKKLPHTHRRRHRKIEREGERVRGRKKGRGS